MRRRGRTGALREAIRRYEREDGRLHGRSGGRSSRRKEYLRERRRPELHKLDADARSAKVEGDLRRSVPSNRRRADGSCGRCAGCSRQIEEGDTVKRNLIGQWVHIHCYAPTHNR